MLVYFLFYILLELADKIVEVCTFTIMFRHKGRTSEIIGSQNTRVEGPKGPSHSTLAKHDLD